MKRSSAIVTALTLATSVAVGCQPPPQADPEFSDAAQFAFREFDTEEPARLAFAIRALEAQVYLTLDLEAELPEDRWMAQEHLNEDDVATIEHPDFPVDEGLPVAVGGLSAFPPMDHSPYLILTDQTATEPGGPDYVRTVLGDAETCWATADCEWMRTTNVVTKQNLLLSVEYDLFKDYRWIDLNLPDPSTVPEGDPIVNEGPTRMAIAARSWTDKVWVGNNGVNEIQLSFSFEVWSPRDGGGYIRLPEDVNAEDGAWTTDSTGGGSLRLMALWSRTNLNDDFDDPTIQRVIRNGIDDIFEAQEGHLASQ